MSKITIEEFEVCRQFISIVLVVRKDHHLEK